MKILGHNSNHQEMVFKQKTVDLHHSGFKLKFPKHFLIRSVFGVIFINVAVVTQNWNNIAPNVYVPTIALIFSIWFKKESVE